MKAQTQVISVVLLTGIIISLVGTAYMWGKPLIEKRTTLTEFSSAMDFILELDKRITDLANSGSGSFYVDIPKGILRVVGYNENDPDNNSIIYEIPVSQPIAYNASTILLKTSSYDMIGMYGEAEPRIITLNVISNDDGGYTLRFKIYYRELDTQTAGYQIALNPVATSNIATQRLTVSFEKKETIPGGASNNGDLILTHMKAVGV